MHDCEKQSHTFQLGEILHSIGKRDAVAEILMMVRNEDGDCKSVIQKVADEMLECDPSHPHALWVKANVK